MDICRQRKKLAEAARLRRALADARRERDAYFRLACVGQILAEYFQAAGLHAGTGGLESLAAELRRTGTPSPSIEARVREIAGT